MKRLRCSTAFGALLGLLVLGCESSTNPTEVPVSQQGMARSLAPAGAELLHTYANSLGHEVTSLVPVSASKLLPLLPAGYTLVPAASRIEYRRGMDDASGVGALVVSVPAKNSPFHSFHHSEQGYVPVPGSLDAVFWHDGRKGKAALHYHGEPFRLGSALSQVYTAPQSTLGILLNGGGLGPCAPDASTGYACVVAPSFNLRYDQGSVGKLLLIE